VELKEKKHRIEDALSATRAAVEEGIVPGGGVALLRAQEALDKVRGGTDDEKTGRSIVRKSLEEPLRQIAVNAGFEGGVVADHVRNDGGTMGFNAQTGSFEDLLVAGIIDPSKVTRSAVQNAASIAGLLLTTEALIVEQKEEAPPAMPAGAGGPGMDF
jgi:chaperonin GroEL